MTNMILDPVLILGPGPFPRLGVTGAAIATVTAQAIVMKYHDPWDHCAEEGECVKKGTRLFAKIPAEFLRGDLQDRNSNRDSGHGVLRNFHDLNANGVRIWCGGSGNAESWRSDRIDLLEYG